MSSLAFLATELQSLASETRRKHPEIREAAEKSLAILRANPEQNAANLAKDGPQSDELLRPIFMGCATKNAKVMAISQGSLQRLIAIRAVPQSSIPMIVTTMGESLSQGVDIQLKVLQTLLSLLTNYTGVHDELLGDALLLCFRLQESRIAVVSSTAAATLRQLVMFVFDKVVDSDKAPSNGPEVLTHLPDGTSVDLSPSARDAFSVFEDLCLLANSERPNFLKLQVLPKTFALELIESVLTNYHALFRQRPELLLLLRHHLSPLLLKSLSDRPLFPLTLRSTRVVFLLLKQFTRELATESEVFLMLLIRVISGETEGGANDPVGTRPAWMRVLSMEILRGDPELLRVVWDQYDSRADADSKVFASLVSALKRLATEKPPLLGVGTQMAGIGVQVHPSEPTHGSGASYGLEVAGRVASVATATVTNVVGGIMGSEAGLSVTGSSMKLQCIDQLDKADSPAIPESYLYLLALQCLVSICEGLASFVFPLYTAIAIQRPKTAGDQIVTAPRALDLAALPDAEPSTPQLRTVGAMLECAWPGLLSALSFFIGTNLSDDLFADTLSAFQNITNVAGVLGLRTPRDAFLSSLSKFAIPSGVVSSVDSYVEPTVPKTASVTDALGFSALGGGAIPVPGLSERNMACLKSIISTAVYLSGSLGATWFDVLEVLQNADYVMYLRGLRGPHTSAPNKRASTVPSAAPLTPRIPRSSSTTSSPIPNMASPHPNQAAQRHPLLTDIDVETIQLAINHLFDATKSLDDEAFRDFIAALCKLSHEMVEMQASRNQETRYSDSVDDLTSPAMSAIMSPSASGNLQPGGTPRSSRRVSGLGMHKAMRTGDYSIARLGDVALLNIHRLIYRHPDIAWNAVTSHLIAVLRDVNAPPAIRYQAAEVLDEILVVVPRNITSTGSLQADIQSRVLNVLSQQVFIDTAYPNLAIVVDIRKLGLETLHKILQSSGHSLVVGWETIFEMLGSVCQPLSSKSPSASPIAEKNVMGLSINTDRNRPSVGPPASTKSTLVLVRIAFQSLTLVCDSLDSLSPDQLRLCIKTLGQFGRQQDTNIALTAAESLLWGVSDSIQAKRKDAEKEPIYSDLWTFLLLELRGLCTDARHEVRIGAIQTLFRTLQLYGATLSLETWDDCLWKVILPLLDALTISVKEAAAQLSEEEPASSITVTPQVLAPKNPWDESKTLALQLIGSILNDFLVSKIMYLESFPNAWDAFLVHISDSVLRDTRSISTAALRCVDKALKASAAAGPDLQPIVAAAWERTWVACDVMGKSVTQQDRSPKSDDDNALGPVPFTQECLQAFVEVIHSTYTLSGKGWDLERLRRLMEILKGILTYANSGSYRPDVDSLTPVQAAVLSVVEVIQLNVTGAPSLVLGDVAQYSTLAFLAAFDYEVAPLPGMSPDKKRQLKRVTYIALAKRTMPMLVQLYAKFKDEKDIYVDGTLERVFAAFSIPMKLKYDGPAPSKFGSDPPLWKTATACFLEIVTEATRIMERLGEEIPSDRLEDIWRQILDVYKGGLLADCSFVETMPLEAQEQEEKFDLALLNSLEIDVVPRIGDPRVPDHLIVQLGKTLQTASRIHDLDLKRQAPLSPQSPHFRDANPTSPSSSSSSTSSGTKKSHTATTSNGSKTTLESMNMDLPEGTTTTGDLLPRERFSYWCFDLLFFVCSDSVKEGETSRRRISALILPSLLARCHMVLAGYVADVRLRGDLPFPRAQEEELIYVLRKMLQLNLWPGTLWAAFSNHPTQYSSTLPPVNTKLNGAALIADAVRRSSRAHLYHFYGVLCEMASIQGTPPSVWVEEGGMAKQMSSRDLTRDALRDIGKEMGVEI
ncbi:hypothetical protein FRB99_006381 [Tulasnella sp. 403]|nr:hypothetical protein FRB99_006381 [Tulasnella sp. 403]